MATEGMVPFCRMERYPKSDDRPKLEELILSTAIPRGWPVFIVAAVFQIFHHPFLLVRMELAVRRVMQFKPGEVRISGFPGMMRRDIAPRAPHLSITHQWHSRLANRTRPTNAPALLLAVVNLLDLLPVTPIQLHSDSRFTISVYPRQTHAVGQDLLPPLTSHLLMARQARRVPDGDNRTVVEARCSRGRITTAGIRTTPPIQEAASHHFLHGLAAIHISLRVAASLQSQQFRADVIPSISGTTFSTSTAQIPHQISPSAPERVRKSTRSTVRPVTNSGHPCPMKLVGRMEPKTELPYKRQACPFGSLQSVV